MLDFEWKEIALDIDVSTFDCGDRELNDFLRNDALTYKRESLSNTLIFLDKDDNIIGYVTTCTDAIRLNEREKQKVGKDRFHLSEFPGVKIARLAVAKHKQGHGYGRVLLYWTIDRIKEHANPLAPASSP